MKEPFAHCSLGPACTTHVRVPRAREAPVWAEFQPTDTLGDYLERSLLPGVVLSTMLVNPIPYFPGKV